MREKEMKVKVSVEFIFRMTNHFLKGSAKEICSIPLQVMLILLFVDTGERSPEQ